MGNDEADKATAVAVLHNVHLNYDVTKEPIEVCELSGKACVFASREVKQGELMLPPCAPKQSRLFQQSEHPYAVEIKMKMLKGGETSVQGVDESCILRKESLFVNPTWKVPEKEKEGSTAAVAEYHWSSVAANAVSKDADIDGATAVAESESRAVALGFAAVAADVKGTEEANTDDAWAWGLPGDQTMHPFWAVRRMTQKQLSREIALGQKQLRFNCRMEVQNLSCVSIGVVKSQSLNTTRLFEIPFMTNAENLEKGEELIMEVSEKKTEDRGKRTWKDAWKDEEKEKEKAKKPKVTGETEQG